MPLGSGRGRPRPVSPAELAAELMTLLAYVHKTSGGGFYALVEELGLSLGQVKALHMLDASEGELAVGELAELLGLSLGATSRNVEQLVRRGYLERREDEHDRRMKRVGLSDSGRELVARLERERLAGLEEFAASLSDSQRRRLCGALAAVLDREEITACRPSPTSTPPSSTSTVRSSTSTARSDDD
ncbi:MAG: MarR family transcriptional regulator [Actinobacteria bacterium]|nr:MAG: MarR family transcriptional regulator [Actinomycetota bacterium]